MKQIIKSSALLFATIFFSLIVTAQNVADSEFKLHIQPIQSPLNLLTRLEPKVYEYDTKKFRHLNLQAGPRFGFLSDNVATVLPGIVSERSVSYMFGKNVYRNTTIKTVDETAMIPLLVAAIKEQQQQIEALKQELAEVKKGR